MSGKQIFSILAYCACFIIALLLPWWAALIVLVVPLFFNGLYVLGIVFGLTLDIIYGYQLAGFPYHTFRYVLVVIAGALVIFLLKKVLRL